MTMSVCLFAYAFLPSPSHYTQRVASPRTTVVKAQWYPQFEPNEPPAAARAGAIEVQLAAAVIREDYLTAATLRDELATLLLDDEAAVLQANTAFYEAFSSCNVDALAELWVRGDRATCIHPGFAPLRGHDDVLESFAQVFSSNPPMTISADGVRCVMMSGGRAAVVTCFERAEYGDAGPDATLTATNIFEKSAGTSGKWRLALHQAGPVMHGGNPLSGQ